MKHPHPATRLLLLAVMVLSFVSVSFARVVTKAVPSVRIATKIDNAQRTALTGHIPAAVQNGVAVDKGRVAANTPLNHMVMVLQGSAEQEHAFRTLVDQQHDKNSINYHQWITPEEAGQAFGVADADVATLTNWLSQQGLTVEKVSKSKRFVTFGGTVGKFEAAFQTQFHQYSVNGVNHVSINTNLSIPTAVSPVIRAIPTVHDFFKKPYMINGGKASAMWTKGTVPDFTSGGGTHYFGAGDFATVYNTAPLLAAGIDGKGITIAIVGRTDIGLNDVQIYREIFNLPVNDPTFIINGEDPGVAPGDDGESYLDVEVSGGAAPGAKVDFVTSKSTLAVDGVDLSAMYIVENNMADIMSISYGLCENSLSADNAFQNALYEQAAAQGISVFVSSGDNGPAACDSASSTYSSYGYAVSGDASTPYNVAVGGTMFSEGTGTYWSVSNPLGWGTALSYIPETPWNEAKGSGATGASGLWSSSGGVSAYYGRPSWQRGAGIGASDPSYVGTTTTDPASPVVAGPHRLLPDVSLNAASGHDGTLYCAEGVCQAAPGSISDLGIVGGTSVAAPEMAGIQALVDQANGGRQGNPNYYYYSLAILNNSTDGLTCTASAPPAAGCVFHDVATGNTLVCRNSSCTAANKIGWAATAGYDPATGLGSVNAYNLATQWSRASFSSSVTTLTANSATTGITHGTAVSLTVNVAPGSGNGIPTGDVAFYTDGGAITNPVDENSGLFLNQVAFCTLSSGACTISLASLPAGSYNLYARYAGDMAFGSSTAAPIAVTVADESSTVTLTPYALNCTTGAMTPTTTFAYGSLIFLDTKVTAASGQGVPTGTVAITDNGNPVYTTSLNSNGASELVTGVISTSSCVYGFSYNNIPTLSGGSHVINETYSGDASFTSSTLAAPVTLSITPASLTATLRTTSTGIHAGDPVNLILTLTPLTATAMPAAATGTVTFTDTTTSTVLASGVGVVTGAFSGTSYYLAATTTSAITNTGAHTITAVYSGDPNYATKTATVTVTVNSATAPTLTLASTSLTPTVAATNSLTATLSTTSTGTVYFYDGATVLGSATLSSKVATLATQTRLTGGTHTITAKYAGSATVPSVSSNSLTLNMVSAVPALYMTAKNVGVAGQTFTFTTVVTVPQNASYVAYIAPTGTVQYYDGVTPLGSPVPLTIVPYASGGYGIYQGVLTTNALAAGNHTITAVYGNDVSYATTTSNAQTVFAGGTPTITWAAPAAITYGTALSSTQLNATSNVPGKFVYTPAPGTVLNAGPQTLSVTFTPSDYTDFAPQTTTVQIQVNQAVPAINWTTPAAITYGTPLSATQLNASSGAVAGTFVYTPAAGTVLGVGTQTLSTTFTPTSSNYTSNTATVSLSVTKATPVITWAAPAAITYGTALDGTQLNASTTIPGTFVYTPAAGAVPTAGPQTLSVTFTPDDSVNYTSATKTVSLTVNKQTPVINWATPAAITYGTALDATQLNATAVGSLPGTFAYTPAAGTVLGAGSKTLSVTFTPTDSVNYASATASVSITVNQATPVLTWATPAAIAYGTPLGAAQLNATSGAVGGTFAYTPAAGTVLAVGPQTLSVTFTPIDATDYTTASATVSLTVTKAVPVISWTTPANIAYGTPLGIGQLNATVVGGIAGTLSYNPALGSVMGAGPQQLNVTFTPADPTSYTSATASVTLIVNQGVITVTANNKSVAYGLSVPLLDGSLFGVVAGDGITATYTTTATSTSAIGSYAITPVLADPKGVLHNYSVTITPGTLSVVADTAAVLQTPIQGTLLGSSNVAFTWNTGVGVSNLYQLLLGTTGAGSSDLYNSGNVAALTVTVPAIPANAQTVYARLLSREYSGWAYVDYVFTEGGTPTAAAIVTPAAGSTLASSTNVAFTWNTGVGATSYQLLVGTTGVGSSNLYSSGFLATTGATVASIPANALPVYVRLLTKLPAGWVFADYTYTAAGVPTPAAIQTPAPGAVLGTTNVAFTWNTGVGIYGGYQLLVGTTGAGSSDVYSSGVINTTSTSVPSIPANAAPVYVRLLSKIAGVWKSVDYTYTEAGTPTPAVITAPAAGTKLTSTSVAFTWSTGLGVNGGYQLLVGTTGIGSSNLYSSGVVTATGATVTIPANAVPVYVRLLSKINGVWSYYDYAYTESGTANGATLISPANLGVISQSGTTFTWTTGVGVNGGYQLQIGTNPGGNNLYNSGVVTGTSLTVPTIPALGKVYARIYSRINGVWSFVDYSFTVIP